MRVLTAWTRVRAVAPGARGERRAEGGQDVLAVDDKGGQRDDGTVTLVIVGALEGSVG